MSDKPINAENHALIDYVFTGVQFVGPLALGLSDEASKTYQALGTGFLAVNALTDTPLGVKRMIPFENHEKADIGFLAGLSILTFSKPIREDKKALCFHLGMLTMAAANYFLTDYRSRRK